ncbi:hypothetical protein GDO86_014524 [Hymenochirus boettgeri]|uniref:SH3 domain-containing protein n=1 Tax=Hymenochirus boettgeri TaxID=247094 RepID=A0A8T2JPH6_9PIPI|nr:hypothetical protein GDO86_014524 [Hymenochirus boettgeri]
MKVTNMLAKAQFDNKADSADELTFRKGDILTVLEQNIAGSEGWWRCYLHGRQGLVPANRLQLFTITNNDVPVSPTQLYGSTGRHQSLHNIYQVPSAPKTSNMPTYEHMDSVYVSPLPSNSVSGDVYQTPGPSPAQIFYDKSNSSSSQHLLTLPRASRATHSTSILHTELYDVPPSVLCSPPLHKGSEAPSPVGRRSPFLTPVEQIQQQIYDIPATPDTAHCALKENQSSYIYDIPPSGTLQLKNTNDSSPKGCLYNTLPARRKSDWIYDIPMSPDKKDIKPCRKISLDRQLVYDVPPLRFGTLQTNSEGSCETSQIYNVPPLQKPSVTSQAVYDIPPSQDLGYGSMKKNSSSIRKQKTNLKENVYDIPRGMIGVSPPKNETCSPVSNSPVYEIPPPLPRNWTEPLNTSKSDRLSVSSSESRSSTLSSSSTISDESFTFSSPEVSVKEVTLDLEMAVKKITQLQEQVSSSIASLMIFVSSKWRLQENMEANLEDIHKSVDSIITSLRMFLDFAEGVKSNALHLTDSNIQLKIKTQLQTLTDSFQMLCLNQEAIRLCNWSLQALVIDKPHTNPDDLDRFVMVARTIPDDTKRFVSIIIANGKLIFRKREEESKPKQMPQVPNHKETKNPHQSVNIHKEENIRQRKNQLLRQKTIEDNDYVHLQKKEEFEKTRKIFSHDQLEKKTQPDEKRKGWVRPESVDSVAEKEEKKSELSVTKETPIPSEKEDLQTDTFFSKKAHLSEHSYLYFGALQKAISVFNNSLGNNQPPEVFITHGKLIIMVGQKLVDTVCKDVKANELRNDILFKSSDLCSLLKNLAIATKSAAIQYPDPVPLQELQTTIDELSKYTKLFREMVE